jgi:WD40 repeat protein
MVVTSIAVSADGARLAVVGEREMVYADLRTGALKDRKLYINAAASAPTEDWFAIARGDGVLELAGRATEHLRDVVTTIRSLAVAPNSGWVASGGSDGTIVHWDVATRLPRLTTRPSSRSVTALAIAPDGAWVVSAWADGHMRITSAESGAVRAAHRCAGPAHCLSVSPDGAWVAIGDGDGTVRIWDVGVGRQRLVILGHAKAVRGVAAHPNGKVVASVAEDATVRVWDVGSGRARAMLRLNDIVYTCAWTPDGSALVVGGRGGLYLFDYHHAPSAAVM